tara:strand:+ start:83 stop:511 length:429 start_codon:yes stop_codon:yes gene_type:complete
LNLLKKISNWFKPQIKQNLDSREFEWCIVGNIVDQHTWGEEKVIKKGTKHFPPNAKVYCMPEFTGSAHEKIRVIGKPRKSKKLINVVINTRHITNLRIQKVYDPKIQNVIGSHIFYWTNRREKKEFQKLEEMVNHLSLHSHK